MGFSLAKIYIIFIFACSLNACTDGSTENSMPPEIESINEVVVEELSNQNVIGGAVAVVRNGAVIHAKGYGHTTLDRDTPVSTETVFRWASISKTLTAVAALQLDEEPNNFSIEDRVNTHFTNWPADTSNKSNITIKQLLSNRSGIIHYGVQGDCPGNLTPEFDRAVHGDILFDAVKAVDVFDDQAICFAPGADYRYSTFGFSLAAAALEKEANVSYAEWVQNNIAAPLNMSSLSQATGTSTGVRLNCGEFTNVTEDSKSYVLPGGGWASSITDLAKFANGLLQGTLLNDTERLWREDTDNSNLYRLGISLSSDGERTWHSGAHNDLRTFMHLYHAHEDDVGIVVFLNNPDSNPQRVAKAVANILGVANWSELGTIPPTSCNSD